MLKAAPHSDRRQFGRRQSSIIAWVRVRGRPRIPCRNVNVSELGALIEFETIEALPKVFLLSVDGGEEVCCEARHSKGYRVGVEFVSAEADENDKRAPRPVDREVASAWVSGKGRVVHGFNT